MDGSAFSSMAPKQASSGQMAQWGGAFNSNPMAAILGTLGMGLAGAYSKSRPELSQMAMLPLMYGMLGRGGRSAGEAAAAPATAGAAAPAAAMAPMILDLGGGPQQPAAGGGIDPSLLAFLASMGGGAGQPSRDAMDARRLRSMEGVTMNQQGYTPSRVPNVWQQMMMQGFWGELDGFASD